MTREIKFRWWNGQRMIPCESLMVAAKNLRSPEHMQYIGLKDSAGGEIYEGDIVLMQDWSDRGDGHYDDELAVIEFRFAAFVWVALDGEWDWINDIYAEQFTIIGNIYETPDIFQ